MLTKGPHPRHDPFTNISSELVEKKNACLKIGWRPFFSFFVTVFTTTKSSLPPGPEISESIVSSKTIFNLFSISGMEMEGDTGEREDLIAQLLLKNHYY